MRRGIGVCFIVIGVLLVPAALVAQDYVDIEAPTVVPGSTGYGLTVEALINSSLALATAQLEAEINTELTQYVGQDDLALGFANAGATAAHVGTQRSFNDYKHFALTVGTGVALSAPSSDPSLIEQAVTDIEDEGDIYFGMATQPIAAALGINLGRFVENLYGTVKVGYLTVPAGTLAEEFSFESLAAGFTLDYQLLETRKLPLGFLRWRGLTVGSGLIYQRNESVFEMDFPIDPVTQSIDLTAYGAGTIDAELEVEPTLTLAASSNSWSIPLEATTGLRILWLFDVNFGAGVDVAFGSSDITLDIESPVTVTDNSGSGLQFEEGSVAVDGGTDGDGPQFVRPRLTGGLGLNLGPIKVDVPVMYYFDKDGNSALVAVNVGIVW